MAIPEPQVLKNSVNFLFEMGILARTPRSGLLFLGTGEQSVAEHINRTVYIGMTLGYLDGTVDVAKVMQMCALHDISEARISDLGYVQQQYTEVNEEKALKELTSTLPFGPQMDVLLAEYKARVSTESILAKDADNLEWLLTLKEQLDVGNPRAQRYINIVLQRLKTDLAKQLAQQIMETLAEDWFATKKDNSWWVNREKPVDQKD